MPSSPKLDSLRALVAARFPTAPRKESHGLPLGVRALDQALGGGLPTGRLTELVCQPGAGGQLIVSRLLASTRESRQRVALIDAGCGFAPEAAAEDLLRHLVWVCPASIDDTFAVASLMLRDGNYAAVIMDLRGLSERALKRLPGNVWHRLHRAAENGPAVLVQTSQPLVPGVLWRLELESPFGLASRYVPQDLLAERLCAEVIKGQLSFDEAERTG